MAGTPESIYTQLDLQLIPLLNLVAEPIAGSAVASAANVGKFYRNTTSGRLEFVRNATTVVSLPHSGSIVDADVAVGAAIAMSKLAVDPTARANHTGTQLSATISDLAAVVQAYRLDQFAAPTANVTLNNQRLVSMADAVGNTDATTLQQVNSLIAALVNGHDWKDGVRVASSVNVAIAAPGANIDGVALANGERVLLYGQTTASQNGVYVFNGAAAAMTRATDADTSAKVTSGMTVPVEAGTHVGLAILTSNDPLTLGTTALAFTILANAATYVQGTGITISGNTISLTVPVAIASGGTNATDIATARANLNTPQRGFAANIPALVAGAATNVVHSLNTLDVNVQVYRVADGATVNNIGSQRVDVNTVSVTADIAVAANLLRLVVTPVS